jgi:predicted NBD/HSP70 family sugar kinase
MNYKKPTAQGLRQINRAETLRKVYFEGPISRLEISRQIGISPATVTNIVNELLKNKIVMESGSKPSEGGRPSTFLTVNPECGYFIGVEVGEMFIQVELFDMFFNFCQKAYSPLTEVRISPQQIVTGIVQGVKEVINKQNINEQEIIGVGVGFPGVVDPVKGISVFAPNWGWHNIAIANQLREKLAISTYIDNGAKAMAVGEMLFGGGRGVSNMAVLLVGTGVGSGIISDRVLFRGFANNAGEVGHTSLNPDGPLCRCGSHGCGEVYIGANGIIERYQKHSTSTNQPNADDQIAFVNSIIDQYGHGDAAAVLTLDETIRYLGVSIANLINAFNPEVLLLGGWSGLLLGKKFLEKIEGVVSEYALRQSLAKTSIRLCQLEGDSVAKGAAALVLQHFFESGEKLDSVK